MTEPSSGTVESPCVDLQTTKALTEKIIGCAIQVHKQLGAGLLESLYENALCIEFDLAGLHYQRQVAIPVMYKGREIGEHRIDLIVENIVVVELKSVERMEPIFEEQVLTYLRISEKRIGLLVNFDSRLLKDGIKRLVL